MDPNLVQNTKNQLDAKSQALNSIVLSMVLLPNRIYTKREKSKTRASRKQIKASAIQIKSDSIDLVAVKHS
jgi:hypothetical protein